MRQYSIYNKNNVLPGHMDVLDRKQCAQAQAYLHSIIEGALDRT